MKYLHWSPEKNKILMAERGICFEEIAYLIEAGKILAVEENPGHPNQKIYILEMEGYAVIGGTPTFAQPAANRPESINY